MTAEILFTLVLPCKLVFYEYNLFGTFKRKKKKTNKIKPQRNKKTKLKNPERLNENFIFSFAFIFWWTYWLKLVWD